MYNWRQMTPEMRAEVLAVRQRQGQPWHGPPHGLEKFWYHLSAACYEHAPLIGFSPERLADFQRDLRIALAPVTEQVCAWCVLPNHYHVLVQAINLPACRKAIGDLHGRSSFAWNRDDDCRGRTCWHRSLPKDVTSEAHRWATLNYIHHNPVRHGYVKRWQEWPFSSAEQYLAGIGRETAERIWKQYPLLDYGRGWDDPER